jgi:hypothetical protein
MTASMFSPARLAATPPVVRQNARLAGKEKGASRTCRCSTNLGAPMGHSPETPLLWIASANIYICPGGKNFDHGHADERRV